MVSGWLVGRAVGWAGVQAQVQVVVAFQGTEAEAESLKGSAQSARFTAEQETHPLFPPTNECVERVVPRRRGTRPVAKVCMHVAQLVGGQDHGALLAALLQHLNHLWG